MEFLIVCIIGIVMFIAGMIIGSYAFFRMLVHAYHNEPNTVLQYFSNPEESNDSPNPSNSELVLEYHGSNVYMFFKKDDVFAGQGSTIEEALEQAIQRFPGVKFSVEQ